jgi:hypothetical protein
MVLALKAISVVTDTNKKFIDGFLTPVNYVPGAWLSPVAGIQWRHHQHHGAWTSK